MIQARFFVFDLDGTLVDSLLDLGHSVNASLQHFGLPPHGEEAIRSFIGNGSLNLIKRSLGAARLHLAPEVHQHFMDYYYAHCTERTTLYPGVREFLETHAGRCALLTNKPIAHSLKIVRHLGLESCFTGILGGDNAPARKPDPRGLLSLLADAQVSPDEALMVGDDLPDLEVARQANVRSVALLSGFGRPAELLAASPDYTAPDFRAFINLLHP